MDKKNPINLASLYKDNIHNFYNIDIIENKYKQQSRYKTIPEITKYMRTEIFDLQNNNNIKDNFTRDIVKSSLYGLFNKKIIKKEITTEQLIQIIQLINGKKPRSVIEYMRDERSDKAAKFKRYKNYVSEEFDKRFKSASE